MAHHPGFQYHAQYCPRFKTIATNCTFLEVFEFAYFSLCSVFVRSSFGICWEKRSFARTTFEETLNRFGIK